MCSPKEPRDLRYVCSGVSSLTPTQTHNADSDVPFISLTSSFCLSQCIQYTLGELTVHTSRPESRQIPDEAYERTLERIEKANRERVPPSFTMDCSSFQPTSG